MANGAAVSTSRAPYIIICNGRIEMELAKSGSEMIRAASRTAADLVSYYGDRLTSEDTKPISTLQHEMMDAVSGTKPYDPRRFPLRSPDELVDEMFALLDALEKKMSS